MQVKVISTDTGQLCLEWVIEETVPDGFTSSHISGSVMSENTNKVRRRVRNCWDWYLDVFYLP